MAMLALGLIIWTSVHLFPSVAPGNRERLVSRLGELTYQGLFSLLIICAILLMVFGWRSTVPHHLYTPLTALRHPAMLLAAVGFILITAASFPTRLKRVIRHPQLTGVLFWAVAHLLLNGDHRSVSLFSTLAVWCVVSMLTINHRDGAWEKPEIPDGWWREFVIVVAGLALSLALFRFHHYLSGIALM